ncbi:MAG: M61 family metallopeptidase [Acidobacteria bacterium]|nr:M61 family metallopeptidase [Acidobacteriota bacterium]
MKKIGQFTARKLFFAVFSVAVLAVSVFAQGAGDVRLALDASDAARNVFHVRQTMTAVPGKFGLFYPKWIPGEHAPTGPLNDLVNLHVTADGKPVEWERDNVEMFAFTADVPEGAKTVEVTFDYVSQGYTIASANLARIKWNRYILYPRGMKSDDVRVTASMRVPAGWKFATALPVEREAKDAVDFKTVNLTTFVDSPAIIGKYFAKIPLGGGDAPAEMDIAAESADALKYKPETLAGWKKLVEQANLTFGARHYNSYKFLLTLSDYAGDEGLEHHESSEDGVGEKSLSDEYLLLALGDLLGHEYTHSWNGKYRRPDRLTTPDFEQPMHGDLLWVYEGLTEYLGHVLPARAGLWTDEMFREAIAETVAMMDTQSGRRWRPVVDTARAVQFTYPSPRTWHNARRGVDYYYEGSLIWLEADVLIREKSGGRLSLNDFLRKFHGGPSTGPMVRPYDFDEVVRTLNEVVPYDWRTFFIERVYKVQNNAPMGGITGGGWKLVYTDKSNTQGEIDFTSGSYANLMYSIGIIVNEEGTILDINPEMAAFKAGLGPDMTIRTVNGEDFSLGALRTAVAATKTGTAPIKLTATNGTVENAFTINYRGGERYPHLVRDPSKPDYLSAITQPLVGGMTNIPPGFVPGE